MFEIGPNTRLRVSPFFEKTVEEGVTAFSPYNKMLMPVSYGHPMEEYDRLMNGVALWDVSVERQVEIIGPDAATLIQVLSVRDLSNIEVGKGKYIPMCDHRGVIINDPVVLKHSDTHFWLSIGDDNILMWARAIAAERGLNVTMCEPDVSPIALQGPKAVNVVADVFGDWIHDLKYFWFKETELNGIPLIVQKSGYSKQGGYEIYLRDGTRAAELWNVMREAGARYDIGPGNPSPIERIESGLLSYGGDNDDNTNPFEVRLGKYVDLHLPDEVVGIKALRELHAAGIKRHQLGVKLDNQSPQAGHLRWFKVYKNGAYVGEMTNGCWSPRAETVIGFILVGVDVQPGDRVEVHRDGNIDTGTVCELPFF